MNRLLRIIQWIVLVLFSLGEIAFSSFNKKVVLIGTDLELRCNYTHNSTWWFDSKSLHGNTQLVNSTLILRINNISINNQGTYWCGSAWKHGYSVSVSVGNLPSQPRSVHSYSYEWNDSLRWVASLQTGGLPVYYTVTAQCPKLSANSTAEENLNCLDQGQNLQRLCTNFPHVTNKKYSCSNDINGLDLDTVYQMCVFAVSELGNSSSCINFTRSNESSGTMTVPAPPRHFKATEFKQGEVRLTWKTRSEWDSRRPEIFVYISYNKNGDIQNTTIGNVSGMDKACTIPKLMANSIYTFYAQCQYYDGLLRSVMSVPSVTSLKTRDATPGKPPHNLTCGRAGGSSQNKRNISLSWEPVPKDSQNGVLTKYIILVYSHHQTFNKTVNASQTSIILPGFSNNDDITFYVRACNEGGFCSGIGNSCFVSAETKVQVISTEGDHMEIIIVGTVTAVAIVFLVLIVLMVLYCRYLRKKKSDRDQGPVGPEIEPPDNGGYEYPDNDRMQEEYSRVDNLQVPLIMETF